MSSFLFGKASGVEPLLPSKRIAVAAGAAGCGCSFAAEMLAAGLSELGSVSLTELGSPHFFDALSLEKHFLSRGFTDFFGRLRRNESFGCDKNLFAGINWIARQGDDRDALSAAELFRAFCSPKEEYCIFDCSGLGSEEALAVLAESDCPVCVVDPLPSRLCESRRFLEKLRLGLPEAVIIVNKMNRGVHRAELERFLGTKDYLSFPSVAPEYIYKAEYNSMLTAAVQGFAAQYGKAQDMLCRLFK